MSCYLVAELPTGPHEFVQSITWNILSQAMTNSFDLCRYVTETPTRHGTPHSHCFSYDSVVERDAPVVARSATYMSRSSNGTLQGYPDMYPVECRDVRHIRRRLLTGPLGSLVTRSRSSSFNTRYLCLTLIASIALWQFPEVYAESPVRLLFSSSSGSCPNLSPEAVI